MNVDNLLSKEPKEAVGTYNKLSNKIDSLLNSMTDKSKLYFALVYVLKPFYMDQRGDEKRRKLRYSAMSSGGFGTTHFKFIRYAKRKNRT